MYGGHERVLRQTVITLPDGRVLAEHENPGEATLYVLHGRARVATHDNQWDAITGVCLSSPKHDIPLEALADSALLLASRQT